MSIPLVILGGKSDKPADYHADGVAGYKPLDQRLRANGKDAPLIEWAMNAYLRAGDGAAFEPIYIAGPAAKYRVALAALPFGDARRVRFIDTDASLPKNIRKVSEVLRRNHAREIAVIAAGDLLPDQDDLEGLARIAAKSNGHDILLPMVVEEDLVVHGAGGQKRAYTILDEGKAVKVVTGQVYCVRPEALRWELIEAGAHAGYKGRIMGLNIPVAITYTHALLALPLGSIRHAYAQKERVEREWERLKQGDLEISTAEEVLAHLLLHPNGHDRSLSIELTPWASLAFDIDTERERKVAEEILKKRRA